MKPDIALSFVFLASIGGAAVGLVMLLFFKGRRTKGLLMLAISVAAFLVSWPKIHRLQEEEAQALGFSSAQAMRRARTPWVEPPPRPSPTEGRNIGKEVGDALFLIEGDGFERTRSAWGAAWVKRINELMPKAGRKVAESPECDFLEIIGLSDQRSVPRKKIGYYADCGNQRRFYVMEDELKDPAPAVSQAALTAAVTDENAITACEAAVKEVILDKASFSRSWGSTSVYRPPNGRIVTEFGFEAKNALGAVLRKRAKCVSDDRGTHPPEITDG